MTSCRHIEWTKINRTKDLMYFLGATELLSIEILILRPFFHQRFRSLSALGGYFVQLLILCRHVFCPLSGDRRLAIRISEAENVLFLWQNQSGHTVCLLHNYMYYFYSKINQGRTVCLLYGGGPYLGEFVMGGSTVFDQSH